MRIWTAAALALALATPVVAANSSDAQFQALYKREWAWRMKQFPDRDRADAAVPDRRPKADPASEAARLA